MAFGLRDRPKLLADQVSLGRGLVDKGKSVRDVAALLKCYHAILHRALNPGGGMKVAA